MSDVESGGKQNNQIEDSTQPADEVDLSAEVIAVLARAGIEIGDLAFGKYQVLSVIGSGGAGTVLKVHDVNLNKLLALKILNAVVKADKAAIRFQNEARALARLSHPNIAAIHDFGLSERGFPFMVMEYMDGVTLERWLQEKGALPIDSFIRIFLPVVKALQFSHECGIIHRDIKPANIMLIPDEVPDHFVVKLLDFGVSKAILAQDSGKQGLTSLGSLVGTPLYMSPEQAKAGTITSQTDMYSLGCVMFESLTGKPPFEGETAMDVLFMHQTAPPPGISEWRNDVPAEIIDIIDRLLKKNPDERYENLSEPRQCLSDLQGDDIEAIAGSDEVAANDGEEMSSGTLSPAAETVFSPSANKAQRWVVSSAVSIFALLMIYIIFSAAPHPFTLSKVKGYGDSAQLPATIGSAEKEYNQATRKSLAEDAREVYVDLPMQWTDRDMRIFQDNTQLRKLTIAKQSITDAGLQYLAGVSSLKELRLNYTNVKNLDALRHLTGLEVLELKGTQVDDSSLDNLKNMNELKHLNVCDTKVSLTGLRKLTHLPALANVNRPLPWTKDQLKYVLDLARHYPRCRFLSDPHKSSIIGEISVQAKNCWKRADHEGAYDRFDTIVKILELNADEYSDLLLENLHSCIIAADQMHQYDLEERLCAKGERLARQFKNRAAMIIICSLDNNLQVRLKHDAAARSAEKRLLSELSQPDAPPELVSFMPIELADRAFHRGDRGTAMHWYGMVVGAARTALSKPEAKTNADYKSSHERRLAYALKSRAHLYRNQRQWQKAEPEYSEALSLFEKEEPAKADDRFQIVCCLASLADVQSNLGKSTDALATNERGIGYFASEAFATPPGMEGGLLYARLYLYEQRIKLLKSGHGRSKEALRNCTKEMHLLQAKIKKLNDEKKGKGSWYFLRTMGFAL